MAVKKSVFLESENKSMAKDNEVMKIDLETCSKNLVVAQEINKKTVDQLNDSIDE
jgi:hypothetical protein